MSPLWIAVLSLALAGILIPVAIYFVRFMFSFGFWRHRKPKT